MQHRSMRWKTSVIATLATLLLAGPANAAFNPFDSQDGAEPTSIAAQGKCGEAKCGGGEADKRCGTAKCGGEEAETRCGEGKCGSGKRGQAPDGDRCGASKCGGGNGGSSGTGGKCGQGKCGGG